MKKTVLLTTIRPCTEGSRVLRCSAPHVHLVGEIAIAFGYLELCLEASIWQLLAGDDQNAMLIGQAITADMSFRLKVDALSSMSKLRLRGEPVESELRSLVNDLLRVEGERNEIMHSAWVYSENSETGDLVISMKATARHKKGLRRHFKQQTPQTLAGIRDRIVEVADRLAGFSVERLQGKVWPRKTPPG
jgi:hypothetical protein